MSFYLAVVSPLDHPLFELSFPSSRSSTSGSNPSGPSSSSGGASTSASGAASSLPSWSSFTGSVSFSSSSTAQTQHQSHGSYGGAALGPSDLGFAPTPDSPAGGAHGRTGSLSYGLGPGASVGMGGGGGGGDGGGAGGGGGIGEKWLAQMVVHKSLDSVEEAQEASGALYLKGVDRHNDWTVSAFLAGSVKFVLLHDIKNDDGIRLFFLDLWEAYIKVLLNPFHTVNTPIRNPLFEAKIRASAKRNL